MTDAEPLSGFARVEHGMVSRYSKRADGWPVGREYRGRAWSCVTPTVQIVQLPRIKGPPRYVVLTPFPFRRTDRRYPVSPVLNLHYARKLAFERLRTLSPDGRIVRGRGHGIELARGGDHLGLEVFQ